MQFGYVYHQETSKNCWAIDVARQKKKLLSNDQLNQVPLCLTFLSLVIGTLYWHDCSYLFVFK